MSAALATVLPGCGGSSGGDGPVVNSGGNQVAIGTSTLVVRQTVQSKAVPASVDRVRISGYLIDIIGGVPDPFGGGETFQAREFPSMPTYTLENVRADTQTTKIEYFDADQLVGVYVEEVSLQAGQTFEIVDPAFTERPDVTEFSMVAANSLSYTAPPGERPIYAAGNLHFPFMQIVVPGFDDAESMLFSRRLYEGYLQSDEDVALSESVLAFTTFSSSDTSVVQVRNGGITNTSHRSGTLWFQRPGDATITANFLGITSTLDVRVVTPTYPLVVLHHTLFSVYDPKTITRLDTTANRVDYQSEPIYGVDVRTELIYRPSDKPEIARWDTRPGHEGEIIRGEAGRVVLWVQHPSTYFWVPVMVEQE